MNTKSFSGDSSLLKSINKSALLSMIRNDSPLSRADLAKRTKLTRATVSALVDELITDHFVVETGMGKSNGGRKPTMLEVDRGAGFVFGLDLRATEILFLIVNLHGEKIRKGKFEYIDAFQQDVTFRQVADIVEKARAELPPSPLGLLGVGIGIHGFVEHPSSRILFAPYFGWTNADWKIKLQNLLKVSVCIDNEANLAALGELESGAAVRYSEMIYLSIGAGIGAGLILDGEVFRGIRGFAGEVGHTTIEREGKKCSCGNRGCWEMYASEKALADHLGLPYKPGITALIVKMLEEDHPQALNAISEVGKCLGVGISSMVHTFNPQMVIIGNPLGKYSKWLHFHIGESLKERLPFAQTEAVEIRYSHLDDEACALGAASMVIRHNMQAGNYQQQ